MLILLTISIIVIIIFIVTVIIIIIYMRRLLFLRLPFIRQNKLSVRFSMLEVLKQTIKLKNSYVPVAFETTYLHSEILLLEELQRFYATHCKSMLVTTCLGTATFILRPSVIMAMNFFALVVVIIHRYLSGTYARKDAFLWLVSTLKFHYS